MDTNEWQCSWRERLEDLRKAINQSIMQINENK
jgi:hypothetical protein